jgi:hypothetical protein
MRVTAGLLLAALLNAGFGAPDPGGASASADPCAAFSWDVTHERALFGEAPHRLSAGLAPSDSPALTTGQLYELTLAPRSQVHFVTAPEKSRSPEGYAGLAVLTLPSAGVYRVALDQPIWVDVVAEGSPIRSRDFQGRSGCNAPHKIVEFVLPAKVALTLQLSSATSPMVRVAVLPAPPHERALDKT